MKIIIGILIVITVVSLVFLGFGILKNSVLDNPVKHVAKHWTKGIGPTIFIRSVSRKDAEYASMIKKFIVAFEKNKQLLGDLDKTKLGMLRNTFFALRGFSFSDPELMDLFGQFSWYRPNSSVEGSANILTEYEQMLVDTFLRYEKDAPLHISIDSDIISTEDILPKDTINAFVWNLRVIDPDADLEKIVPKVGSESAASMLSAARTLMDKYGLNSNSLQSIAVFNIIAHNRNNAVAIEIFLEIDEPNHDQLALSFGRHAKLTEYKKWQIWSHNNGQVLAASTIGVLIASSKENAYHIIDEIKDNTKSIFENIDKLQKKRESIGIKIAIKSTEFWPITIGPASIIAEEIEAIVVKSNDNIIARAVGKPTITLRQIPFTTAAVGDVFTIDNVNIPAPSIWPQILLNSVSTIDYKYSLIKNEIRVEMKW